MIALDHGAVMAVTADIDARINAMEDTLINLEKSVAGLREQWGGDAQDAYAQAHEQWASNMVHLREVAQALTSTAASAARTVQSAEAAALQLWS